MASARKALTSGIVLVASATTATGYYYYSRQRDNKKEEDEEEERRGSTHTSSGTKYSSGCLIAHDDAQAVDFDVDGLPLIAKKRSM
jgi:hypothetical protein